MDDRRSNARSNTNVSPHPGIELALQGTSNMGNSRGTTEPRKVDVHTPDEWPLPDWPLQDPSKAGVRAQRAKCEMGIQPDL